MGASLISGLIADGYNSKHLWVSDPDEQKLKRLEHQFAIHITTNNHSAVQAANTIILAVKPQILAEVSSGIAADVQNKKPLIISIAAGVREASLQKYLGGNIAIVRSMPNTPALIGCGASALFANEFVSREQKQTAEKILRAVGLVTWLEDEKLMDIVTALSGSGPAYFFLLIEILQETAEKLGLPKDISRLLTLQTAFGASRMALESEASASQLRQQVTSPGGTTEQAVRVLEENNIRRIFSEALLAAKTRSEELAKQ